jgi:hypothetical protein
MGFEQSSDAIRFEISAESGDRRYRAAPSRGYAVRFHGVQELVQHVRVNGKVIPKVEAKKKRRSGPYWELTDGDVVVSLPRSSVRRHAIDFATAPK